jgi:acetyl-CoA synthetase
MVARAGGEMSNATTDETGGAQPRRARFLDSRHAYTGQQPPQSFNLARYVIGASAERVPDKIALLVCDTPDGAPVETWTYREIESQVLRAGQALRDLGLSPGDRLLIQLPNTSLYASVFFGAIAVGLIPIPASNQLTQSEVHYLLEDSGAALLIAESAAAAEGLPGVATVDPDTLAGKVSAARPAAYTASNADDPAYLIYTSGTTSHPKGVLHAHRAAWGRRPMYEGWYGLNAHDRVLHAGAFNWTYTLGTGLTDPWVMGATSIVYLGEKSPEVWPRLIRTHEATLFAAVPSLYRQILKYAEADIRAATTLRHGLIAGETPPPELLETWHAVMGRGLYEALGMSEVSTYISSGPATPPRAGFAGRAQPGRSVAILPVDDGTEPLPPGEEGRLAVHRSDPALMLGYWNRPEEEAEVLRGEWFIGGDLAVMDADGYIAHRGRANDIMKALGYRVAPQEVEEALLAHPAIADVACAEVPVKAGVSVIGAFIIPTDAANPPSEDTVLAHAATCLAAYKCPRLVRVIDTLPRTANGKLKRSALKDFL